MPNAPIKPLLEDTYGSKVRAMATRIATLLPYAADAAIGKVSNGVGKVFLSLNSKK